MKTYQIVKYVKAKNAAQAIKRERDTEVYAVEQCKPPQLDDHTPAIGFSVENPIDEEEE